MRNLINACRVTPIRFASRSIARSKSTGKSTFTRWTSRPGRVALPKSRCAVRSSPASCISSRRAALSALVCDVLRFFVCARAADRDDGDFLIAVGDKCRPRFFANSPDHLITGFVKASSRNLQPIDIHPNLLRLDEVDSMLALFAFDFSGSNSNSNVNALRYRNYTTLETLRLIRLRS